MHLIVGATGSLGGAIAIRLLERGAPVRALVRTHAAAREFVRHTDPEYLRSLGAEIVQGDLTRPETLPSALDGVIRVVSTASATKRGGSDTTASVDVRGTEALARAAAAAGVHHFVYVSTVGARADAAHPLFRDKGRAEQAIAASGVPATVLHPVKFMQDWIGFLLGTQLASTSARGRPRLQWIGDSEVPVTFVDEGDVADLALAVLGREDTIGQTIALAAEAASYRDLAARIARTIGRDVAVEALPLGGRVDTVPAALAGTITSLLTMAATGAPDATTTPEVAERFGLTLTGIDAFLRRTLAA